MTLSPVKEQGNLQEYRDHLRGERSLSEYTVRNYLNDLDPFFQFMEEQGVESPTEVDRGFLRRYVAWLMSSRPIQTGRSQIMRGHERASVTRSLAALRSYFRYLVSRGVVPPSPLWKRGSRQSRALIPKAEKTLPRIMGKEEVVDLLTTPDNPETKDKPKSPALQIRDRAILEVLYATGLRVSELSGLDMKDVDMARRRLRTIGKGSKEREVVFGKPAQEALERYINEGRPKLGDRRTDALFLNRFGGRLTKRSSRRWSNATASSPLTPRCTRICSGTRLRRICWMEARTCASYRSCLGTHPRPPPRYTPM